MWLPAPMTIGDGSDPRRDFRKTVGCLRPRYKVGLVSTCLAAIIAGVCDPAAAQQSQPRLPGSVEPGRTPFTARPQADPLPPEADLRFAFPPRRRGGGPQSSDELKIVVRRILVTGNTVVPDADFAARRDALIDVPITINQLNELADFIQARYVALGFPLTRVVVPPQEVADQTVRLRVIEGFVDRVIVETKDESARGFVERRLAPLADARPTPAALMERGLLLTNDLPGLGASALLRPGAEPGAAEMVVEVERQTFAGFATIGNRGTQFAGPWSATVDGAFNGLLGFGEQIGVTVSATKDPSEQRLVALRHIQPLLPNGLTLTTTASLSRGKPGASLKPLAVATDGLSGGQKLSLPLTRSRADSQVIELGWDAARSTVDLLGQPFIQDDVRSVSLKYGWSGIVTPWMRAVASVRIVQGLGVLGASSADPQAAVSRPGADPNFTRFVGDGTASLRLGDGTDLTLSASGQYAPSPLLASEEFTLGGARFGRGYDPGDLGGRNGLGLSAQVNHRIEAPLPLVEGLTLSGFADWGHVWRSAVLNGWLGSVGAGARLDFAGGFALSTEVARPIRKLPLAGAASPGTSIFVDLSFAF